MSEYETRNALPSGSWLKGRYQILNLLGHGGFGNTYRAYDAKYHEMVAIKELYPSGFVYRDRYTRYVIPAKGREQIFEVYKGKFKNEADIMHKLRNYPKTLKVYDRFAYGGTEYYTMQFLEGENLKEYLIHNGKMTWQQFAPVIKEVLDILKIFHQKGYIHRDIKPDNIFLTRQGKIYLIDYGNVRDFAHADHFTELLTDYFAPPEQYLKKSKQRAYTDVYSLCATIYYCLSGKLPPVALSRTADKESGEADSLVHLSEVAEDVPSHVSDAVHKGLRVETEKRFQTIQELENALFVGEKFIEKHNSERAIYCVQGMLKGNRFQIPKGKNFSVGRAADIQYPQNAVGISRIQFYLFVDWMGYVWIFDPDSTNGVSVDNQRIAKETWKQISTGQMISFVNEVYELV